MKKKLLIQDNAVVADFNKRNPIGEAIASTDPAPAQLMSTSDREKMLDRLEQTVKDLVDKAEKIHNDNCSKLEDKEQELEFITRLITNEFFFYTKEPLSLEEFEVLQNKIATIAASKSAGIHLILASFAVKTAENKVLNVVPHISCGEPPKFNFIVKNHTSSIDVRYRIPEKDGESTLLAIADVTNSEVLPEINLKAVPTQFSFNNLVSCNTPGGSPFLTAVDICRDHLLGVARENIRKLEAVGSASLDEPISHVVTSNTIGNLKPNNCWGTVMHVDPLISPTQSKIGVSQRSGTAEKPAFGKDHYTIHQVAPFFVLNSKDELEFASQHIELFVKELRKKERADWGLILETMPKIRCLFKDIDSQIGLSLAEEILIAAYKSGDKLHFEAAYKILKHSNLILENSLIERIIQACPNPELAKDWVISVLKKIDPQLILLNELQKDKDSDWKLIFELLPTAEPILYTIPPQYPFFSLNLAEQILARIYRSGDPQNFSKGYELLKKSGFILTNEIITKLSKIQEDEKDARKWFQQQLIITDSRLALMNELQGGNEIDWKLVLELMSENAQTLPIIPWEYPFYSLSLGEQILVRAISSGNPANFKQVYFFLKQTGYSLNNAQLHRLTFPYGEKDAIRAWVIYQLAEIDPPQLLINEMNKTGSINWDAIVYLIPQSPNLLSQPFSQTFSYAEYIIALIYHHKDPDAFKDVYPLLYKNGFSLDFSTIKKISDFYDNKEEVQDWLIQQLLNTNLNYREIVDELDDEKGEPNWNKVFSLIPKAQNLLESRCFPTKNDLTLAEQILASAYGSGDRKIFIKAYTQLKKVGFNFNVDTIYKISQCYEDDVAAQKWINRAVRKIDPTKAIIIELQQGKKIDWELIFNLIPPTQGRGMNEPCFPGSSMTLAENILATAAISNNPRHYPAARFYINQLSAKQSALASSRISNCSSRFFVSENRQSSSSQSDKKTVEEPKAQQKNIEKEGKQSDLQENVDPDAPKSI